VRGWESFDSGINIFILRTVKQVVKPDHPSDSWSNGQPVEAVRQDHAMEWYQSAVATALAWLPAEGVCRCFRNGGILLGNRAHFANGTLDSFDSLSLFAGGRGNITAQLYDFFSVVFNGLERFAGGWKQLAIWIHRLENKTRCRQ
jgi:hypothetical protein